MTFKEMLIKEAKDMQKVEMEIFSNAVFIAEERQEFERELKELKEVISYIGD